MHSRTHSAGRVVVAATANLVGGDPLLKVGVMTLIPQNEAGVPDLAEKKVSVVRELPAGWTVDVFNAQGVQVLSGGWFATREAADAALEKFGKTIPE